MTQLIFVRHGETAHNAGLVISSRAPGNPLNERGFRQAADLAERLAPARPAALYSSPLLRARQTADILAVAGGLDVNVVDDLRECEVGSLEGQGSEQSFTRFNSTFDHWYLMDDLDYPLGPGGETGRAALRRFRVAVNLITANHPDGTVVAVSHGTLLQLALTGICDNLPWGFAHGRWISNGGTAILDARPGQITCRSWDGTPIDDLLARRTT